MPKTEKTALKNDKKDGIHVSVLKEELISSLGIMDKDIVLDCTINGGGHSTEILKRFKNVSLIGLDQDEDALRRAEKNLPRKAKLVLSNFRNLDSALSKLEVSKVNRIIFDLGLSSDQLEKSGRGFSFRTDEPLLMTLKKDPDENTVTAHDVVNNWAVDSIESILRGFGEERFAKRIAEAIVSERQISPIETSMQLANIVKKSVPSAYKKGKINPATKTFQAIRIAVNDEFGALLEGLEKAWTFLDKGGRIAVITFHSLEDRIVKQWMRAKSDAEIGKLISKKPIAPSRAEVLDNPRSRSAKLRIIEKI